MGHFRVFAQIRYRMSKHDGAQRDWGPEAASAGKEMARGKVTCVVVSMYLSQGHATFREKSRASYA